MQKFHKGDLVHVAKNLGPYMSHFTSDVDAIVIGSYSDQFGGNDTSSYTLYLKDAGESSWYEERQLSLIDHNRMDILKQWEAEEKSECDMKSNLDWIFTHGVEVLESTHGATVQALASCFGLDNLWGSRGEGATYYSNTIGTLQLAEPFLKTGDKAGWLKKAEEIRLTMANSRKEKLLYGN